MSTDSTADNSSFPLDELMAHAAWLRRLALVLVRDAAAADDLVQEAWVAALERPPATDRPLRPWLGGVLRNLVKRRARTERRRTEREQRVASERTSTPTPAELTERLELQRRLAAAVAALDEPFRSTLQLRYDEGLSAAEISRRDGVPAGTVRWRLKTALDRVRERMDQDHGGDRRAWVLMWIPLAAREAATGPSGSDAGTQTASDCASGAAAAIPGALIPGALAMSVFWKLAAVAGSVVAIGLCLSYLGNRFLISDPAPDRAEQVAFEPQLERRLRPGRDVEEPEATNDGDSNDAAGRADDTERAAPAVLRGRVVDDSGRPVAGAWVVANGTSGVPSATAGSTGEFELSVDLPDVDWRLEIEATARSHAAAGTKVHAERGATIQLPDLVLTPGGAIRGVVYGESGLPLAGARIELGEPSWSGFGYDKERRMRSNYGGGGRAVLTDADGQFEMTGVPVGVQRIWAMADDHLATVSGPTEVRVGMVSSGLRLELPRLQDADLVEGQVRNPDGTPATRAMLRYEYNDGFMSSGSGSMTTDAEGRFRRVVTSSTVYQLSAIDRDERFGGVALSDVPAGAVDLVLQLVEPRHVRVVATSITGPVEAFDVLVIGANRIAVHEYIDFQTHGADGARIKVPAEAFLVRVGGALHSQVELGPFDLASVPDVIRAELRELPGVRGVVTAGGVPVKGAQVDLHEQTPANQHMVHNGFETRWNPQSAAAATTDDQGRFRVNLREAGTFMLRVTAPGLAPSHAGPLQIDPVAGRSGLSVQLTPGAVLEGRTGPGQIVGISAGAGHPRTTRADPDGNYRFEHLAPGGYQVRVVDEEIVRGNSHTETQRLPDTSRPKLTFDVTLAEGQTLVHDLAAARGSVVLAGRLRIGGAEPLGWNASVLGAAWTDRIASVRPTAVGSDGSFRIRLEQPGPGRLMVLSPAARVSIFRPIRTEPGENRFEMAFDVASVLVLEMPAASTVGVDGMPALVWRGTDGVIGLTALVAETAGDLAIDGVPVGRHALVRIVRDAAYADPTQYPVITTIDVREDGSTEIDLPRLLEGE